MSDDIGYGDLGSYGGTDIKTTNIDSMAAMASGSPILFQRRALQPDTRGLISGRYQQRVSIENALGGEGTRGLKVTGNSLPQILKNNGYRHGSRGQVAPGRHRDGATQVGGPRAHGFEYFFGLMGSHVDYCHHNRGPETQDLWENETRITLDGSTDRRSSPSAR